MPRRDAPPSASEHRCARRRRRAASVPFLAILLASLTASLLVPRSASAQTSPRAAHIALVRDIVDRASAYVATFVERAAVLLASEHYEQEMRVATNTTTLDVPNGATIDRRTLESEVALVQMEGDSVWLLARDVLAVDGRPLDESQRRRLTTVRVSSHDEAMRRFKELATQGARFNLGSESVTRNINVPTLGLWLLTAGLRERFEFEAGDEETIDGVTCRVIIMRERRKPYLLNVNGTRTPLENRLWIRPDTGIVVRTEMRLDDARRRGNGGAVIRVDYMFSDAVQAWVPREMEERYLNPGGLNAGLVVAKARYRDYKQFVVESTVTYPK